MSSQQKLSILLVEDDECAGELLISLLKRRFPQALISFATDGSSGLEAVRKYLPDIVITDINMPEMDGVQLIKSIAAIKPDTRELLEAILVEEEEHIDLIESHMDQIAQMGIQIYLGEQIN